MPGSSTNSHRVFATLSRNWGPSLETSMDTRMRTKAGRHCNKTAGLHSGRHAILSTTRAALQRAIACDGMPKHPDTDATIVEATAGDTGTSPTARSGTRASNDAH